MARARKIEPSDSKRCSRVAASPEARENQLIALAVDLAEQQLRDGTASSQVIKIRKRKITTRDRIIKSKNRCY